VSIPTTWPDLEREFRRLAIYRDWRIGQAAFNTLNEFYPEIADMIHGTSADPFYAESARDPRYSAFLDAVMPYFV
jgi:hypothetical protein